MPIRDDFSRDQRSSERVGGSGDPTDEPADDPGAGGGGGDPSGGGGTAPGAGSLNDDSDDYGRVSGPTDRAGGTPGGDFSRDQRSSERVGGSGDPTTGSDRTDDARESRQAGGTGDPRASPQPDASTGDAGGDDRRRDQRESRQAGGTGAAAGAVETEPGTGFVGELREVAGAAQAREPAVNTEDGLSSAEARSLFQGGTPGTTPSTSAAALDRLAGTQETSGGLGDSLTGVDDALVGPSRAVREGFVGPVEETVEDVTGSPAAGAAAGGAASVANVPGIARGAVNLGEGAVFGVAGDGPASDRAGAVLDATVGAVTSAGRAANRRPAETTGRALGAGVAGFGAGRPDGPAGRGVVDRARTRGADEVDASDLTNQRVLAGDEDFPGAQDPGLFRSDPAEAVRRQAEDFTPPAIEDVFDEAGVDGVDLKKALDVEPEGPADADGGFATQEGGFESPGAFVGPELSPNFLRISESASGRRIGLPSLGLGRPTGVVARTDVENPDADTLEGLNRELVEDRVGDTTAVTKPSGEVNTGEIEAILPPEAEFSPVGDTDFFTRVEGRRVPVRTVAPRDSADTDTGGGGGGAGPERFDVSGGLFSARERGGGSRATGTLDELSSRPRQPPDDEVVPLAPPTVDPADTGSGRSRGGGRDDSSVFSVAGGDSSRLFGPRDSDRSSPPGRDRDSEVPPSRSTPGSRERGGSPGFDFSIPSPGGGGSGFGFGFPSPGGSSDGGGGGSSTPTTPPSTPTTPPSTPTTPPGVPGNPPPSRPPVELPEFRRDNEEDAFGPRLEDIRFQNPISSPGDFLF